MLVTCKLINFLSALQTCSCTLSAMMNSPLCCLALLSYCRWGSVRNVAGAPSLSSPSPLWQRLRYPSFTPWSSLSLMVKRPGSAVTLPSSWHCSQRIVIRWPRRGCWGVCLSGFFPGCFCWLVCCCSPGHLPCFTSAQYASDTTVSFLVPFGHLMHVLLCFNAPLPCFLYL